MVFKKPYAFFIKYFRLINFVLVVLLGYLGYKLNLLVEVVNEIYKGDITNYLSLNSTYIGFGMYVLIFLILVILSVIVLLLKNKNKPFKDYLFAVIYILILCIYLMFIGSIFTTLEESIIELTDLKLYSDISYLIVIPMFYFVFKFILIVIGFSLNKFNFTKDIIELKQEEKDSEEVEIIFDKNTYKYKRKINRTLRELKYYFLENRFFITIISCVVGIVLFVSFFSFNIFKSNKVGMNKSFVAGSLTYKINEVYETKYDLNYNIIKENSKFVIASVTVSNKTNVTQEVDFKRIRLIYKKEYVYANNYFNKHFYDLGVPYNREGIISGESQEYIFVFEVPNTYKSRKYELKFYNGLSFEDDEVVGAYKKIKVRATNLDKKREIKSMNLNENVVINKSSYGDSNITILGYNISNNYIYYENGNATVLRDKDINNVLLVVDYKLKIDENSVLKKYFSENSDFFNKFVRVEYTYNGKDKIFDNINIIGNVDGKVLISLPYEVKDASALRLAFDFRDIKIVYILK